MDQLGRTATLQAAILNAAYMVRYYARGGRSAIAAQHRDQAIHNMGTVVRDAFNESSDFEILLAAIVVGLSEEKPPF